MADLASASVPNQVRYNKKTWTFRGHSFTAWIRPVANMDEEASILAEGMHPEKKRITHHTRLLQEYCRKCVREVRIQGPAEDPNDVEPITGHELADAIEESLKGDADYCWSLYINLGAADVANIGQRAELVEAVQGKPDGSSTMNRRTPSQTPNSKPPSIESSSGEEE